MLRGEPLFVRFFKLAYELTFQNKIFREVGRKTNTQSGSIGKVVASYAEGRIPVKNYWRGVVGIFGMTLLKRRRIAGEVSTLYGPDKAAEWAGTAVFGIYIRTYAVYIVCIHMFIYAYV